MAMGDEKWGRNQQVAAYDSFAILRPACSVVPDRCHTSGAAVDAHRDTPAWVQRAERTADGGVVDVPRALSVLARSP